jgi:hypothetical protein
VAINWARPILRRRHLALRRRVVPEYVFDSSDVVPDPEMIVAIQNLPSHPLRSGFTGSASLGGAIVGTSALGVTWVGHHSHIQLPTHELAFRKDHIPRTPKTSHFFSAQ